MNVACVGVGEKRHELEVGEKRHELEVGEKRHELEVYTIYNYNTITIYISSSNEGGTLYTVCWRRLKVGSYWLEGGWGLRRRAGLAERPGAWEKVRSRW